MISSWVISGSSVDNRGTGSIIVDEYITDQDSLLRPATGGILLVEYVGSNQL